MARLALLWHLHQPDYRDPGTGVPIMPWTRLHALRGYRDMLLESVETNAAWTINVVPVLVDQLLYYAEGGSDRHLDLSRRPADGLEPSELRELEGTFPTGNRAMSDALPRYRELRARLEQGGRLQGAQEARDLQVFSTLAWLGATARRDFPSVEALRRQGGHYDEGDKRELLRVQDEILREIPALLRRVAEAEGPSLSTTPYFHPILPLVIDARSARRCMPWLPDEVDFAWPQDALRHLVSARARIQEVSGVAPVGLWPSEGSVSPEVVELAAEAGFRWLATDGGVLARSDRTPAERPGGWDLGHGVRGFFRDTELSDRIGFRYAHAAPFDAAADLLEAVQARARGGVLTVALDGENPWEAFADAGRAFRDALLRGLRVGPVRATTLDEAAAEAPVGRVRRLHTGSWIGADFRIWIGHPEDRAAWKLLARARRAAEAAPPELREEAMPHLLAAEGSDWTWWYGDDFDTPFKPTFDRMFRTHLQAAWRSLGQEPPPELAHPVGAERSRIEAPRGFLRPHAGGRGWTSWVGAGRVRVPLGSMATVGPRVRELRYGWSRDGAALEGLWVRIVVEGRPEEGVAWQVEVDGRPVDDGAEGLRRVGDDLVVHVPGGEAHRLQVVLRHAAGEERWPEVPVELVPPSRPTLAWWGV